MAEDSQQTEKIVFNDYHDSSFLIFLDFLSNLKFKNNSHWSGSLRMKINAVHVLSEEVKTQYTKAIKEKEELERDGKSSGIESTLLLIKFETMLNSIYSLCDNLAFIGYVLHPKIKRSFNEQRNNIEKYRNLYPEYSEYLDLFACTDWYDTLHTMRSESTHYLPGFIYHSDSGLGVLYRDMEHSSERIEIDNVLSYVNNLIIGINNFLENYGNYHLTHFISDDHKTFHPCGIPHPSGKGFLAGGRVMTLSEYLKKQPGKCIDNFECPNREYCPAYEKKVDR